MRGEERIDPLLLRLALAEQALDMPAAAIHVADLRERFALARRRGDSVHRREEARFTLDLLQRPDEALRLATDNWAVQREPWDARLVLSAAAASGVPAAAEPAREWLRASRLEDVRLKHLLGDQPGSGPP